MGSLINRRGVILGSAGLLALRANIAHADSVQKNIDLRNADGGDPSWVLFFGRNRDVSNSSFAGHAFVGIGKEDSGVQMSWLQAFGLYPKSAIPGVLSVLIGPVPGELKQDAWRKSDIILSCRVSPDQFTAAKDVIDRWVAKTGSGGAEYRLMNQDCVSFAFEVASALNMNLPPRETVPDTLDLPVTHIRKLSDLN